MDVRWNLKSHLTCTLVELILGHARWMRGEISKVILHAPHVRTFPLYTFQMLSRMDARWHLRSHLVSPSCENFGVVEGTLGHARWTRGEIWKVISCAPHMRTLVWWRGHLVMLDGCEVMCTSRENFSVVEETLGHARWCEVMFEKSSHVHLVWELWCGGGDTWSR